MLSIQSLPDQHQPKLTWNDCYSCYSMQANGCDYNCMCLLCHWIADSIEQSKPSHTITIETMCGMLIARASVNAYAVYMCAVKKFIASEKSIVLCSPYYYQQVFRSALLTVHNKWKSTYGKKLGSREYDCARRTARSNRFIERAPPFSSTFPFSSRSYFWALALFSLSGTLIATIGITVMVNPNRFRRFFLGFVYGQVCCLYSIKHGRRWKLPLADCFPWQRRAYANRLRSHPISLPHLCSISSGRFDSFVLSLRTAGTDEPLHFGLFHVCRNVVQQTWAINGLFHDWLAAKT